jgi:hypothetical protein
MTDPADGGAPYIVTGTTARATAHSAGPWHPGLQHGGAPSALIVWAAERVAAPVPMRVVRLSVELLRPVPVAELAMDVQVLRQGRKIQLVEVRLSHEGNEVARGTVLKVRTADLPLPEEAALPPLGVPLPDEVAVQERQFGFGFAAGFELRGVGGKRRTGPAQVWFRRHAPIVEGEALSPAMRAAAVGDWSNGVANALPWDEWTFINADLTVSLAREPVGEWILSDAESWASSDGTGLAMCRLADERGTFGRAIQSLVLEPRQPAT